ncbi:MAG TPA: ribonuclease H-like domain-containing protein [Candidatus Deferrimicrobiaceae bacterium]|nr:ribonuclease H-like domain-containing protein [Candidatus Deferrimicrobiaceae bacterium]
MARDLTELTRIIRRIEAKSRTSSSPASPGAAARPPIEALLDGVVEETERGRLLVVRRRFPVGHRHGAQPLLAAREATPAALALLSRGGEPVAGGRRLLYLDTETTGLAGGTGTYAFLVGVGFFDGDEFEVRQFFMRDLDEEPALLTVLEETFRRFDGFVTYNGAGFDLPLLETRFVLGRRRFPGEAFHVDLLGPARRLWSGRLADCRLGTVEENVLRFTREDDLPGALIPTVYFEYLRRKRPDELPRVFEHNRHDILSLAALTGWVADAVARAPHPELDPDALAGLGRMLEGADPERSLACYRMALDTGLPTPSRERLLLRLALREKRLARWDEARALWEAATRSPHAFDPRPWEEIAKVHEHRRRDLQAARQVVEQALALARRHRASERVQASFEYRLERLGRRLERVAGLTGARQPA